MGASIVLVALARRSRPEVRMLGGREALLAQAPALVRSILLRRDDEGTSSSLLGGEDAAPHCHS